MKTTIALIVALSTIGCVGGDDPSQKTATPPALSCLAVLSCVNQNCTTDACVDTCMQQGSTAAQTEVTNLATCYQNNGCQDATCLQQSCSGELQACVGDSAPAPKGTPSDGQNLPPGNVPAEFVGTWNAGDAFDASYSATFVFNADGTARYANGNTGELGSCMSSTIIGYDGTAVIDATTITFYSESASTTQSLCGQQGSVPAQLVTTVYTYTWNDDGSFTATEQSCAAEYAGYPTSIGLYCASTFRQ